MTLDEYQQEVLRTAPRELKAYPECVREAYMALKSSGLNHEDDIRAEALLKLFDQLVWCLGLAGEVGETLDLLKKSFGHGHDLDLEKLKKEFGDVRWYGAALEHSFGFKSSEVAEANKAKLRARFPSGFTVEASKAKADENQRCERCHGEGFTDCMCLPVCSCGSVSCPEDNPCALHECTHFDCFCPTVPGGRTMRHERVFRCYVCDQPLEYVDAAKKFKLCTCCMERFPFAAQSKAKTEPLNFYRST